MDKTRSFTSQLKRFWHFVWHDDSWLSWIVNVLLAFILVKFIVYPGLGLLLGTTHPIVAVVSGSMEHNGNFDTWWQQQAERYEILGITQAQFATYRFTNGFNKGDIMIIIGPNNLKIGDVIVFIGSAPEPIIHRIVAIHADGTYQTKGDSIYNPGSRDDEKNIPQGRIIGKAVFRIPHLGWLKILFVELLHFVGIG